MNKCVGRDGKVCGKVWNDPKYPDDNLCDECFEWYSLEVEEANA